LESHSLRQPTLYPTPYPNTVKAIYNVTTFQITVHIIIMYGTITGVAAMILIDKF